ncbi:MAG: MarR family transcriptional regulator [Clostridia bacterium]|nr:MarR family transcriptional regulator [Clostridia bacterium]
MPALRSVMKKLNYLHVLHRLCVQQVIYESGLHFGQPPILDYVKEHEGCTQRELSDFLCISPPSVATSVKRLQRAGFLEKLCDDQDLRRTRLRITPLGREAAQQCRAMFDKTDEKLMQGFSQEETETLMAYLDRMIDNLADGDLKGESVFSLIEKSKGLHVRTIRDRRNHRHV